MTLDKLKKKLFTQWNVSGFTDMCGEWVSTYSSYYTWVYRGTFENINDYYLIYSRRYKKGYVATIYLSKTNSTRYEVESACFDTQKECKAWFFEMLVLIENSKELLNSVCLKRYRGERYIVKDAKSGSELFCGFGDSYIYDLRNIFGQGNFFIKKIGDTDYEWDIRFTPGGVTMSGIKEISR